MTEAAEVLGLTRAGVVNGLQTKALPGEKVGKTFVLYRNAVEAAARRDGKLEGES